MGFLGSSGTFGVSRLGPSEVGLVEGGAKVALSLDR